MRSSSRRSSIRVSRRRARPHGHLFLRITNHGAAEGWTLPEFVTLTKLEVCMFIPYNTLAFSFVPPRVRPLTHAMVSATFNVAVSAVTLGYCTPGCAARRTSPT